MLCLSHTWCTGQLQGQGQLALRAASRDTRDVSRRKPPVPLLATALPGHLKVRLPLSQRPAPQLRHWPCSGAHFTRDNLISPGELPPLPPARGERELGQFPHVPCPAFHGPAQSPDLRSRHSPTRRDCMCPAADPRKDGVLAGCCQSQAPRTEAGGRAGLPLSSKGTALDKGFRNHLRTSRAQEGQLAQGAGWGSAVWVPLSPALYLVCV